MAKHRDYILWRKYGSRHRHLRWMAFEEYYWRVREDPQHQRCPGLDYFYVEISQLWCQREWPPSERFKAWCFFLSITVKSHLPNENPWHLSINISYCPCEVIWSETRRLSAKDTWWPSLLWSDHRYTLPLEMLLCVQPGILWLSSITPYQMQQINNIAFIAILHQVMPVL